MSKSDLELEFGCESDDLCPKAADGKHQPDPKTLTVEHDGDEAYIDVSCGLCGRSGCVGKFDSEEVAW
jgi:hypothetical protein